METNIYYCTRTGRTISEKTMEDGKNTNTTDNKTGPAFLGNIHYERPPRMSPNGHELSGEGSNPALEPYDLCRPTGDTPHEDNFNRKRINPLRIHLGKRPFVDNSLQYYSTSKKKKIVNKVSEKPPTTFIKNAPPRVPKLIPKHVDKSHFHNVTSQVDSSIYDDEKDKPVPRLVPKSQLQQFKKTKDKAQLQDYVQSLGLQPMVKFKCRKCCSMSFKTLAKLKEHQLICRAQVNEPTLSSETAATNEANSGGPSRVTRKVFLCSACGTYYENWNLFLHMREVHNRHICLFCLGMFSKAEKLSSHLTNKHNVQEFNYESKEDFLSVYNGTLYLMCCVCDEICSEQDDFYNHDCNNVKPKPVPVLVSKSALKPKDIVKHSNGPTSVKDNTKMNNKLDNKQLNEIVTLSSRQDKTDLNVFDQLPSDSSVSSKSTENNSSNTIDSGMELDSSSAKPTSSPIPPSPDKSLKTLHNGDDSVEHSDDSDSQDPEELEAINNLSEPISKPIDIPPPKEKEREGGIKLKLSLNNANSPVIINSTVDPTIGQNTQQKPPTRPRRPPKRYSKNTSTEMGLQMSPFAPLPKTPSIKMTICDKSDNPFVKKTVYENDQETTLKALFNNNLETTVKSVEFKENKIKSTIYDNKVEDINTMNRVPKLTVRVPKELLDKDSSSDYSSDSDVSDKLTVVENNVTINEEKPIQEPILENDSMMGIICEPSEEIEEKYAPSEEKVQTTVENPEVKEELKTEDIDINQAETEIAPLETKAEEPPLPEEPPPIELVLDRPLDKYPLKDLLKVFLATTYFNCIYCNHVRKIAVNCEQLSLHMATEHRFSATVDSITAEELMPETISSKVKAGAEELRSVYINFDSYDSVDKYEEIHLDKNFECFKCYFKTTIHKDLYFHNRKMHQKTILLCVMCKSNFYSYSELLCHLCPGTYDSDCEIKFRCCLCNVDTIPSSFRLMVHLRKIHHTCDVCLEFCQSQARLSNHVWKHKLHHLCYRCGIAYRNKPDITKHLFWKHGTESEMCKKCLQKKWPHVYHFCTPPTIFVCDECTLQFTKAVYLKVHKRFHTNEFPHVCEEEGCTEKFVSKKLLLKHAEVHKTIMVNEEQSEEKSVLNTLPDDAAKENIPIIDLVDDKNPSKEAGPSEGLLKATESDTVSKKTKKKKNREKDALLLDVNLPALNLSESDSSDESDSGLPPKPIKDENDEIKPEEKEEEKPVILETDTKPKDEPVDKVETIIEPKDEIDSKEQQQVLDIWDNFKKYQAKVEKHKEKTPPLVPIRKHVCESDHDYCVIPTDLNGDEDMFSLDKKKNKKSPKKRHGGLSSSSSSSSDSDSSCSCGSNCSCSSSSGSSSSSSSDSDSSDDSSNEKKKNKQAKRKQLANRRVSNGSNVDVMGMSETPILIPEKTEPPIAETDLETEESDTDEEFYDEHPQKLANKIYAEKRNQLMLLASVAPSDGGAASAEVSRCTTPVKDENKEEKLSEEAPEIKEKSSSSKKKSKKKKKSKSSRNKHGPIKLNIPKGIIANAAADTPATPTPLIPNKITISLQSNTVQLPSIPKAAPEPISNPVISTPTSSLEKKRASKRRRVPNKFYGYSSDDDSPQAAAAAALKPQLPPKLEWRKEDLPSPVTNKTKKEVPSSTLPPRPYNYMEPIRLTAPPMPDPEPPRILMNSESMESSESDSSEGALEIYQPNAQPPTLPPPTYLNSGTSSLPYAFQRPAARQAREGESVYCYCRCPYDEVSEMIACDADGCAIEWFHFECVGIMVPPKGKWYCPECRKNQSFSGYR